MSNAEPIGPQQPAHGPRLVNPEEERRIRIVEEQIRTEERASRFVVIGWLLLSFTAIVLIFLPAGYRDGKNPVLWFVLGLGAVSLFCVGNGVVKRHRLEKEVRPKQE